MNIIEMTIAGIVEKPLIGVIVMYEQLDIFSFIKTEPKKFHPIEEFIKHGDGFKKGREQVIKFFSENPGLEERTEFLKREYTTGSFLFQTAEPFVVYNGTITEKGCEIEYFDMKMERIKLKISYGGLAKTIGKMIAEGRF